MASNRPAPYAVVKQQLKHGLAAGQWPAGALMPSEAELVAQHGVSRMTVNRALRELQAEGLVERVQGVGTFAARLHRVASTLTLHDLHDEIEARGHVHQARVQLQRAEQAGAGLAEQLGLQTGAQVFHTLIVHLENGVPLQLEDRYVNPACSPSYLQADFSRTTPTQVLFDTTALWRAQYSIEAEPATADEARLLAITPGSACLVVTRRTFSRDAAITLARLVHPGQHYSLHGEFQP
jgi:GntR family transcriptional regulator, histidine utilization repressor